MAEKGWLRKFEDPIPLPDGRMLVTLRDAATYITALPKKEAALPEWQAAIEAVCTENLNPNVLAMKSAQYGARIYDAGSLNLARDRRIFVQ